MKKSLLLLSLFLATGISLRAQLVVTVDTNTTQLVNDFVQYGVAVSNITYTGSPAAIGTFSNGSMTNIGMDNGIILSTGVINMPYPIGSPVANFQSSSNGGGTDAELQSLIPGYSVMDVTKLEFDFVPAGNVLQFDYVFASEEYPEYVGTQFNDVFGFFVTGPNPSGGNYVSENIALIPGTNTPVAINNVNAGLNSAYYVDNQTLGGQTIVFDGFTTLISTLLFVVPDSIYHLKMAIGDAGDQVFDSGIFLSSPSLRSYTISGINEKPSIASAIYPNPLTENSVMTINLKTSGKVSISLKDHTGRTISERTAIYDQAGNHSFRISEMLNDVPSGVYFLGIQTPDGYSTQKIVK